MADATALGIHPPSTVRLNLDGWTQDWPHHLIELTGDEVIVHAPAGRRLIYYPYEHARELPDGTWVFHGREDFTATAGPPQPLSMN